MTDKDSRIHKRGFASNRDLASENGKKYGRKIGSTFADRKFSDAQIRDIRTSSHPLIYLSEKYQCDPSMISMIKNRKRYTDVE